MDILAQFKNYLLSQKNQPSKVTVKNYLSDINHFIKFFEDQYKKAFSPSEISFETIRNYKTQSASVLSESSLDRHMSSLRKFFYFLKLEGYISSDPFKAVLPQPVEVKDPWHIKEFKNYLYVFNASNLTIKNYIIDIRQFLTWAETVTPNSNLTTVGKINKELIEEYKQRLITHNNFSATTVNRKLSSLRKYLSWAQEEGFIKAQPEVTNYQTPVFTTQPEAISQELSKTEEPRIKNYSWFPPLRVAQKMGLGFQAIFDKAITETLAKGVRNAEYIAWKVKGKHVFTEKSNEIKAKIPDHNFLKVSNIKKEFYAPLAISTANLPSYKKYWIALRYKRPNWYKTYHSYPLAHYLNFAVLIIIMAAIGFGFYTSFFDNPKNQRPILAAAPVAPPRILSFQGRLTDSNDNPITSPTWLRFGIYTSATASDSGTTIFKWQETDYVSPDTDGIFNVLLGQNSVIPPEVFTQNSALWLGVTVGQTAELTPRQPLATVAYATNAETLQGMYPTTATTSATNVILALDSSGNLSIGGTATPTFQATGGQFKLLGQPLVLGTNVGSNANVTISPDGLGKIDLQKPLQNSSYNNNISTAQGAVEVDDMFAVLATSSGQSAVTINQGSTGPIISASASGVAKFTVDASGNVTAAGNGIYSGTFTINGNTLSIGNGSAATINTPSGNAALTIAANGSGQLNLNTTGTGNVSVGNSTGTITLNGSTTVASGKTLTLGGITGNNAVLYATTGTGVVTSAVTSTAGQCLVSGGSTGYTPSWGSCSTGNYNFWQELAGAVSPINSSDDLLIGGSATSSADFAFTGMMGNQTQASFSGQLVVVPNKGYGGNITTVANYPLSITPNGTGALNLATTNTGAVGIGNSTGTVTVTSPNWNVSSGGAISGLTGYSQASGNFAIVGTGTFSTGTGNISLNGTTINVGNGVATTIQTPSGNAALTIAPNGTGALNLATTNTGSTSIGNATGTVTVTSSNWGVSSGGAISGLTGYSQASGNFAISGTGTLVTGTGNITLNGSTSIVSGKTLALGGITGNNAVLYATTGTGVVTSATTSTSGQCLVSGAGAGYAPSWGSCSTGNYNFWQELTGALSPVNSGDDLLIGGSATASAEFAFTGLGLANHQTQASFSGQLIVMPNNGYGGNVGIGTNAPAYTLDVTGTGHTTGAFTIDAGAGSANAQLNLTGRNSGTANNAYILANYQGGVSLNAATSRGFVFSNTGAAYSNTGAVLEVSGSQAIGSTYVTTAPPSNGLIVEGNVGIGTAAPQVNLDVFGTEYVRDNGTLASVLSGLKFVPSGGINYIESAGAAMGAGTGADLRFTNMNATATWMTIQASSGNVGIGTTNPGQLLTVGPNSSNGQFTVNTTGAVASVGTTGQVFFTGHQVGSGYSYGAPGIFQAITDNLTGANNTYFQGVTGSTTNFSVRADGQGYFAGNVGIGTNNPVAQLDVRNGAVFKNSASASTPVTPFASSSAEFLLSANSLVTIGESVQGNANPAITLYRTTSGNRIGTGARLYLASSNFDFRIQQGTNGTAYGAETYTDRLTINSSGYVGIGNSNSAALFSVGSSSNFQVDATGAITTTGNGLSFTASSGDTVIKKTGASGILDISSNGGTSAVRFNYDYGGGTGGIQIYDGATTNNVQLLATSGNLAIAPSGGTGSNVAPTTNQQIDLGDATHQWRNIYGQNIYSNGVLLTNGGAGFWQELAGALSPVQPGDDLLIGGSATASADFAFTGLGLANHQTQASFSGQLIIMPNNGYGGNVGIGTTTPGYPLDVAGNARLIGTGSTYLTIQESNSGSYETGINFVNNGSGTNYTGSITSSWWNNGMTFTSPRDLLQNGFHFKANSGTEAMHIDVANSGITIGSSYANTTTAAPSNGLIVQGNVGIGTTSPTYAKLQVNAPSLGTNTLLSLSTNDGTYNPRAIISHVTSTTSQYVNFDSTYSTGTGYANWIFSDGNMGIGTTAPYSSALLHVRKDQNATTNLYVTNKVALGNTAAGSTINVEAYNASGYFGAFPSDFAGVTAFQQRLVFATNSDATGLTMAAGNTGQYINFFTGNTNNERMRIDSSGNVGIGTTTPLATLDARGNSASTPVASFSGTTTGPALGIDSNTGGGDLINASSGLSPALGRLQFKVTNLGSIYGRSFTDLDNNSYFLDPAASGTSLTTAGAAGIGTYNITGTTTKLDVAGGIGLFEQGIMSGWTTTTGGGTYTNQYFPIASVSIPAQYGYGTADILISKQGAAGSQSDDNALVHLQVKQQAAFGSPPIVSLQASYLYGIKAANIVFVLTSYAGPTTGTLYIKNPTNYEEYTYTALSSSGSITIAPTVSAPVASLPTGTQTNPTYGFYSYGGNMGIGTDSPGEDLSIGNGTTESTMGFKSSTTNALYFSTYQDTAYLSINRRSSDGAFARSTYGAASIGFASTTTGGYFDFNTANAANTNPSFRMRIGQDGKVGIATQTPSDLLDISESNTINITTPGLSTAYGIHLTSPNNVADYANGITFGAGQSSSGTTAQAGLYVQSSGAYGTKMYFATTNSFATGAQTRMMIDHLGNVGIGTTSPQSNLTINTSSLLTNHSTALVAYGTGNAGTTAGTYSYPAEFQTQITSNTERLQIAGYKHDAAADWSGTGFRIQYAVDNSFTDGSKAYIYIGSTTSYNPLVAIGTNGSDRLTVDSNGRTDVGSNSGNGGYISSGNYGGTGTAAYFPTGIWSNGSNSWIYGTVTLGNGTTPVQISPSGGFTCSSCVTQADMAANSVGAGQLKDASASTSCGSGTQCHITGQQYSFFPHFYSSNTSGATHCFDAPNGGSAAYNMYIDFASVDCNGVSAAGTGYAYWNYITASDHPTIWLVVNADGTISGLGWEAEDPIEPLKYPDNPNPLIGSDIKPGQYFLTVQPPSIDQLKAVMNSLPASDSAAIISNLSDYIVKQRDWTSSFTSLDDINNISDRYKPSARQWTYRKIAEYYNVAPLDVLENLFTIDSSTSGNLIAVSNPYQTLMNFKANYGYVPLTNPDTNNADLAEWYKTGADTMEAGDLATIANFNTIGKTTTPYDSKIIGVVSTSPNRIMGEQIGNNNVPMALSGRVPVKITNMNGDIQPGDYLTSSPIPGYAMKATKAGAVVGKSLGSFSNSDATQSATLVNGVWQINDGLCNQQSQTCANIGTDIVLISISSYDPDVYITTTGDFQIQNTIASTPSANVYFSHYYNLSDMLGNQLSRMGEFLELVVGNLRTGAVNAQEIATKALSINGVNISDYVATIVNNIINQKTGQVVSPIASDSIKTNLISPTATDSAVALRFENDKLSVLNTNNSSGSAVATIDNQGNASFSGKLSSNQLETNDASISGTLHVGKIIADQIEAGSPSATYVTNITNIYNSTPSSNTNFGLVNGSSTSTSSGTTNQGQTGTGYMDISSMSGKLSYVPTLSSQTAAFSEGLTVFGPSSLSDVSITGQVAINGSLILANNSINVLGSDFNIQPLRQGGVSIMAGLVYIDTNGNVTFGSDVQVKGTLYANAIAPIPGNDLAINLASPSGKVANLNVTNATGSSILSLNGKSGDLTASGAGTFAKLNLSLIQPAQALSETEITATGSAGTAWIFAHQKEVTIDNSLVTDKSLIYITPTADTKNQVIYLLRQVSGKSFTVGLPDFATSNIPFNWIIVN